MSRDNQRGLKYQFTAYYKMSQKLEMTPSPHPSAEAHELEHGGELGELGVQGSTYVRLPRVSGGYMV